MTHPTKTPPHIATRLVPLIGLNQDVLGIAASHSHEKGVQHKVMGSHGIDGPADNTAGVQSDTRRQREPAFPCAHVWDIRNLSSVRVWNGKAALQDIEE